MKRVNWASYKINQHADRVGVFVSVVSTRIPYKGAGKEYIADDMDDMVAAVKSALQACCVQLKIKIARQAAAREQAHRRKNLTKYVPNAAAAIFKVLDAMADEEGDAGAAPPGPKRAKLAAGDTILARVRSGAVTEATLAAKLTEHVERIDTDAALEFQMQQGLAGGARASAWLVPASASVRYGPDLAACGAIVRVLMQ